MSYSFEIKRVSDDLWEIPRTGGMRVPGRIFASQQLMRELEGDECLKQVYNVAHLPGILKYSLAMPDIHFGYGFPIGGVAAVDAEEGVISPGGVGYDINCGVRLVRTRLGYSEIKDRLRDLVEELFRAIPAGVGAHGAIPKLSPQELKHLVVEGVHWTIRHGYGRPGDHKRIEEGGCLAGADPEKVSQRAIERGLPQVGTLGSGNHFLEVDRVAEVFRPEIAQALGLEEDQIVVQIHTGSRGFGYQVCEDYLRVMGSAVARYGISLPDRQLACVPLTSPEARDYLAAMACAANYAWVNRQVIMHLAEGAFGRALGVSPNNLGMSLIYDVCHNIAKFEEHPVDGRPRRVCVHRKGATRAFGAGHPAIPGEYRPIGQPVLVPGDMGRASYVLVGTEKAMEESFGSTCHGAGRVMSRTRAKKMAAGRDLFRELETERGVIVRAESRATVAEEIPESYKDVSEVVDVMDRLGLSLKVARLKPIGVIKG